jgi:hypothetical protein
VILCNCFLASIVSVEKSAVYIIVVSMKIKPLSPLTTIKILFLSLII